MSERLDRYLVRTGLAQSRERAQGLIRAGAVWCNGAPAAKPAAPVGAQDTVEVRGQDIAYVGRGGLKLEKALRCFALSPAGQVCLDVGASTGGFTDCLLQNGAALVYAVDVGSDQLAAALQADSRVVDMPHTSIRTLTPQALPRTPGFFTVDVAFLSLEHVFPTLARCMQPQCEGVCLVKPQFEAGPALVGKNGVVHSPAVHAAVLRRVIGCAQRWGFAVPGLTHSPIRGAQGNVEFLLHLCRGRSAAAPDEIQIALAVRAAHAELGRGAPARRQTD